MIGTGSPCPIKIGLRTLSIKAEGTILSINYSALDAIALLFNLLEFEH
jgi:hypothetical protein